MCIRDRVIPTGGARLAAPRPPSSSGSGSGAASDATARSVASAPARSSTPLAQSVNDERDLLLDTSISQR
eukprot:14421665-Alexandrium_andersonii.AAC.1